MPLLFTNLQSNLSRVCSVLIFAALPCPPLPVCRFAGLPGGQPVHVAPFILQSACLHAICTARPARGRRTDRSMTCAAAKNSFSHHHSEAGRWPAVLRPVALLRRAGACFGLSRVARVFFLRPLSFSRRGSMPRHSLMCSICLAASRQAQQPHHRERNLPISRG